MGRRKKKIVEDLTVHGIADKGMSVARDAEGMVYFVKGGVPGDVIDMVVLRKKKGFKTGVVKNIKSYSEKRVDPFCKHFETCGGCKWQNLKYEDQLVYKQENVVSALTRIGKIPLEIIEPIIGSEKTKYYRNKLEYSFSTKCWLTDEQISSEETGLQKPALGFHAPGTYDKVIDVEECFLQDSKSDEIRNWTRNYATEHKLSYFDIKGNHGFFRNMFVRNTTLGEWMVNIVVGENKPDLAKAYCDALLEKFPILTSVFYTINLKQNDSILDQKIICHHGPGFIKEKIGDLTFKIGPKSFFQTNSTQAKVLYDKVVEFAELSGTENVYDLYTGTGSIALYLADKCKQVTGIETVKEAIDDAHYNKELNGISNADFVVGDVKDMLNLDFQKKYGKPDIVVTDPPRAGMHKEVVETLLQLETEKIVYVSCNPATQARDLQLLSEKYETIKVQGVDMFPHTSHIESIALLKRK
jgi:23S rRNA (uracil1939-C5)-methyltransferase